MKARISRRLAIFHFVLATTATPTWSDVARAGGDADAGAGLSIYCAYCHGADGNPFGGEAPRLAGRSEKTLVSRMKVFRQAHLKDWTNMMMVAFITAGCLDDEDMEHLAAYYSKQPIIESDRATVFAPEK